MQEECFWGPFVAVHLYTAAPIADLPPPNWFFMDQHQLTGVHSFQTVLATYFSIDLRENGLCSSGVGSAYNCSTAVFCILKFSHHCWWSCACSTVPICLLPTSRTGGPQTGNDLRPSKSSWHLDSLIFGWNSLHRSVKCHAMGWSISALGCCACHGKICSLYR